MNIRCAHLKQVMNMKDQYLKQWGYKQLEEDAKLARERSVGISVRKNSESN